MKLDEKYFKYIRNKYLDRCDKAIYMFEQIAKYSKHESNVKHANSYINLLNNTRRTFLYQIEPYIEELGGAKKR